MEINKKGKVANVSMELSDWAILFLKHQDVLRKEIRNITTNTNAVLVEKKDRAEKWLVIPHLQDFFDDKKNTVKAKESLGDIQGIICLNTKNNLSSLLTHWKLIIAHPTLKLVFANIQTNERWVIVPSHHARVADASALKLGLESMFAGIKEVCV